MRQEATDIASERAPFGAIARKIALLCGESCTPLSRFRPIIEVAREIAREVVILSGSSADVEGVDTLGARVVTFGARPGWSSLAAEVLDAWKLARLIEDEEPDVVHLFGLKSAVLGSMAARLVPDRYTVMQLPDLATLAPGNAGLSRLQRHALVRLLAARARKPTSFLLVENADDLALLRDAGIDAGARIAMLGGMGVDPDAFPVLPQTQNAIPVLCFVADLAVSNGADVLMRAFDRVWAKGVRVHLEIRGAQRTDGRGAVADEDVAQWALHPGVRVRPPPEDVRELWRHADVFVLPAKERTGIPRTLLEAAASGRPLIVSDVAGSRDFVRDGVEGLIVPPGDIAALAEAIERLARDPGLRARMGEAARLRILQGFTEAQVKLTLRNVYRSLLGPAAHRFA